MRLTVGFDATAAARQHAGIGRYTRELLRALAFREDGTRYKVFYAGRGVDGSGLPPLGNGFKVRSIPVTDRVSNAVWHRARFPVPIQTLIGRVSVLHSPDFTAPPALGRPTVVTVHDLAFEREPECAVPSLRQYLRRVVRRSASAATHVIAVSRTTKQDLMELYDIPEDKISVIYEGVAESLRTPQRYVARTMLSTIGIEESFILSVGTLEPRKNYVRLLEAYRELLVRGFRRKLVIAGGPGWMYEPVLERMRELRIEPMVILVRPSDLHLAALYAAADAFVYPSLYEGFGIPALEALSAGTPTAVSSASSLPEVVGDAALLFDPRDTEGMTDAMERLLTDRALADSLRQKGPQQAAGFSWTAAAEQTAALYRALAGG
jgi:glycosyltransferase involved in cell wall biosynthesis